MGEIRTVQEINGGDYSIDLKDIDLDKRAIHIHGGMEHNLAEYAKYYSCGSIEVFGSSEFIRQTKTNKR